MTRIAAALLAVLLCCGGVSQASGEFLHTDPPHDAVTTPAHVHIALERRSRTAGPDLPADCFQGRLTLEGDTCQAMRTKAGKLITLGGPLRGFGDGDTVCVCGVRAKEPFCRQGVTIIIREIAASCSDIR